MNVRPELRIDADKDHAIPLADGALEVWLSFHDELDEEWSHSVYNGLLSDEEKAQQQRFYFSRDRQRYLVTRALVRTVLSRYVALDPREWSFSPNAFGRPEIVNAEARDQRLSFNLSHAHNMIALAVSSGRAVGIDVENFLEREAPIEIADRYFSVQEVAALHAAPPVQRPYRFFEYWTFKEAYIKARGMGLSLPLDKFSFSYADDRGVEIEIDPELDDPAERWQFWQFSPASGYLVALCAERINEQLGQAPPALKVRQVIPGVSEKELAVELLRRSS